ncbi:arylesterase [Sphingomonas solaris]|uniref:arylesterase n=1 Tax=Alterirhizorhabdus solaris TaxID=2529389 RepID=UPI003B833D02
MREWLRSYGWRRALVHVAGALSLAGAAPALAADKLVLAFGDSLTAGYGLKPNESFPAQLEASLRRQGVAARVHNAGVSGDTTAGGKARLAWVLNALKAKPDLAIVELGANDMLRGLPVAQARGNLDAILGELQRRRIPVLLAGMRSAPNMGRAYVAGFEGMYPTLAGKYRAGLYPFFLDGVTGQRGLTLPDGLHPTARGVGVIVRGITPRVKAALAR